MGARAGCFVSMAHKTRRRHPCGTMVRAGRSGVGLAPPRSRGSGRWQPRGSCHSVGAMFLLRDLVSPRPWLAMISHLAGLFLGLAVIVVFVTGLSLGFSLLVLALTGLPILGLTLRAATLYATAERARLDLMLGVRIPAWPAEERAGYRWGIVPRWRMLTERATWGELGYGLLRLPFSAVAVTLCVSAWAAGLTFLTLPLYNTALPSGGAEIGDTVLTGTPTMAASGLLGPALVPAAPPLTPAMAFPGAAASPRAPRPPRGPGGRG